MGEKERNGKKLFVPGDVPPSDLLQKRTASYAVQSLVMGARKDGKAGSLFSFISSCGAE